MNASIYLTRCKTCGGTTSRKYYRDHAGQCKLCATGIAPRHAKPTRQERILDCGWEAYAREEGHYDSGDR